MNSVSTLGMAYRTRSMVSVAQAEIAKLSGEVGSGNKADVAAFVGTRLGENITLRNLFDQIGEFKNNITLVNIRMDTMASSYDGIDEVGRDFLGKLATMQGDSQFASVMKNEAISVLSRVQQQLNVSVGDRFLFSGVDASKSPIQDPGKVNPATGRSPIGAMQQLAANTPPTDATSAQALVDAINAAFNNDPSIPADLRFEGTFYNGTPANDASGNPNARVGGRIDHDRVLNYGKQANDEGFKNILKGIYMVASLDLDSMSPEAYTVVIGAAFDAVTSGLMKMRQDQAELGGFQKDADQQIKAHDSAIKIMNERIVGFETVNMIEANAKMTILETQLQASLVLTSKMANLSLASMMI